MYFACLEPFRRGSRVWHTEGQTERQTEWLILAIACSNNIETSTCKSVCIISAKMAPCKSCYSSTAHCSYSAGCVTVRPLQLCMCCGDVLSCKHITSGLIRRRWVTDRIVRNSSWRWLMAVNGCAARRASYAWPSQVPRESSVLSFLVSASLPLPQCPLL